MTNATRQPHGFTLLETVLAMAVMSAIMLGIGSAMLIASRAMPDARSPAAESIAGTDALERMVTELQYAISVNQRSSRVVEFTVADRNADGAPEVIRYEWSGMAGDPLTRKYNSDDSVDVLSNIHEFSVSYDLQAISTEVPQGSESAETLLIRYDSSEDDQDYPIKESLLYSEYFRPILPADAVGWKVTRVRFQARRSGPLDGEVRVQLQTPTAGGMPSGVVLEERTLAESNLWLPYLTQELTYTRVSGLSPQQGLCLVFHWAAGAEACRLLGQDMEVAAPNIALLESTDKAASWCSRPGASLLFSVYGTVTTIGTPQIQNTYSLNAVSLRLKAGTNDQATVQTSVRTLNRPQVTQ